MDDVEDHRRARNARRRRLRAPSTRAEIMDELSRRDPGLFGELEALRARSPQEWRKRLIAAARRLELYEPKSYPERT